MSETYPAINRIVDRQHVSWSFLRVIRYFLSRLKPGTFRKLPRDERRKYLRAVIERHQENRRIYCAMRFQTIPWTR